MHALLSLVFASIFAEFGYCYADGLCHVCKLILRTTMIDEDLFTPLETTMHKHMHTTEREVLAGVPADLQRIIELVAEKRPVS